jgi:hypothetical protein
MMAIFLLVPKVGIKVCEIVDVAACQSRPAIENRPTDDVSAPIIVAQSSALRLPVFGPKCFGYIE